MTGDPPATIGPDAVDRVADILAGGGLVLLPTDTVYGLAARAADAEATRGLFRCKGRAADVPVAVLCTDVEQALGLAGPISAAARRLAEDHWPGALTLVLPRRVGIDWALGEPAATIGVRCPAHDLVRALAARVGPIATTSANRHGRPTPATAAEAAADLACRVDLVVDGGVLRGAPSTVVDATGVPPVVLRQGSVHLGPHEVS